MIAVCYKRTRRNPSPSRLDSTRLSWSTTAALSGIETTQDKPSIMDEATLKRQIRDFNRQFKSLVSAPSPRRLINAGFSAHGRHYTLLTRITEEIIDSTTGSLYVKPLRDLAPDFYGRHTPPS